MTLAWTNLVAWYVQLALIVAVCAGLPWLFRLRTSRAVLGYWHVVLLVCLALPLLQPWIKPEPVASRVTFITGQFRLASPSAPEPLRISWSMLALGVLSAGMGLRLLWLGIGLNRLRRYRAIARPLEPSESNFAALRAALACDAQILISDQISSPVTFGLWSPVILLPDRFGSLPEQERASIVCHELIHVRRRDWAIAVAEELVRSLLWFHPAVWWLLGRIQLTREQVVDQEVIAFTGDRDRYLDALLAIASLHLTADLAPAPLFLKKRHLRRRVESIVAGVGITTSNRMLPLAAIFATLPLVIGIAAWQFPLRAAPDEVADDAGVELQPLAAKILHRTAIAYPGDVRARHISGTVVVALTLNRQGEVTDAQAVGGPQELRKPVLQSVLNWHFSKDPGSPPELQLAVRFDDNAAASSHQLTDDRPRTIESVNLNLLPPQLRDKVLQSGVLQTGSAISPGSLPSLRAGLHAVDEHLLFDILDVTPDKVKLIVLADQIPESFQPALAPSQPKAAVIPRVLPRTPDSAVARTVESLDLDLLPPTLRTKVEESGLAQVGSSLSPDGLKSLGASLRNIDDHLRFAVSMTEDKLRLVVMLEGQPLLSRFESPARHAPGDPFSLLPSSSPPTSLRIGRTVQAANLLQKVAPLYPPEAKEARIQGTVRFNATIGPDGLVKNLQVVSGHPMLVRSAMQAVKDWVYKPTLLNGNPVEVVTTIDVNFTLSQ